MLFAVILKYGTGSVHFAGPFVHVQPQHAKVRERRRVKRPVRGGGGRIVRHNAPQRMGLRGRVGEQSNAPGADDAPVGERIAACSVAGHQPMAAVQFKAHQRLCAQQLKLAACGSAVKIELQAAAVIRVAKVHRHNIGAALGRKAQTAAVAFI